MRIQNSPYDDPLTGCKVCENGCSKFTCKQRQHDLVSPGGCEMKKRWIKSALRQTDIGSPKADRFSVSVIDALRKRGNNL